MEYNIMLRPYEVREFVEAATKSDCYIDASSNNHFIVDAKSILGVLGLDLNRTIKVTVHGYDRVFEQFIRRYAVAC